MLTAAKQRTTILRCSLLPRTTHEYTHTQKNGTTDENEYCDDDGCAHDASANTPELKLLYLRWIIWQNEEVM